VTGDGRTQANVSIDRIDSRIGYVYENVQLVCKAVNLMDYDDLQCWCQKILVGLPAEMEPELDQTWF